MTIQTITINTDELAVVPRVPTVSNEMKARFIGEFSWKEETFYYDEDGIEHECEMVRTVPWDLCKRIFKEMSAHWIAAAPRPDAVAPPRPEAGQQDGPVEITLGKGDKLVADIFIDDTDGVVHKTGVGIFDPEPGKVYGIGVKDNRIDGFPISADRNPLVLIWSDKPESLQVIIDELQEAIARLTGQQSVQRPVPTSERVSIDPDALSNYIRLVDGCHVMGAGELADKIADWVRDNAIVRPAEPDGGAV